MKPQYPSGDTQSGIIIEDPENRREERKKRVGRKQTILQPSQDHYEENVTYDNRKKKYCCNWGSMHSAHTERC